MKLSTSNVIIQLVPNTLRGKAVVNGMSLKYLGVMLERKAISQSASGRTCKSQPIRLCDNVCPQNVDAER